MTKFGAARIAIHEKVVDRNAARHRRTSAGTQRM
jgi:hypothetical protein